MIRTIAFLVVFTHCIFSYRQSTRLQQNISRAASRMVKAFLKGDYKTFISYNYRPMVQVSGGPDRSAENIAKTVQQLKAKGMVFKNITLEEPSTPVRNKNELQATLKQHSEIQLPKGRLVSTSMLIAISVDNGATWTFIDASNKSIADLRKLLPNLSPSIALPPAQPPVRYNQ